MHNQSTNDHLYTLILCGEGETNLWPLSSSRDQKQFLKLLGKKSTYQHTYERAKILTHAKNIFVITDSPNSVKTILKQTPSLPSSNVIVEPSKKGTSMAIGLGAAFIYSQDPEAIMITIGSDLIIKDAISLKKSISTASETSQHKSLAIYGVKPSYPTTEYGYIKVGNISSSKNSIYYKVLDFVEKPTPATAKRFVDSGNYYWNSSIYTCKVTDLFAIFASHMPRELSGIKRIIGSIGKENEKSVIRSVYQMTHPSSFEESILQKEKKIVMIPVDFGWSHISNWNEIWEHLSKDSYENAVITDKKSKIRTVGARSNLIMSKKRNICIIGVEDLIVIEVGDSLLVCDRHQVQYVKQLTEDDPRKK